MLILTQNSVLSTLRLTKLAPWWYYLRNCAGVMELADMRDLGSRAQACRFKSCHPHQKGQQFWDKLLSFLYYPDIFLPVQSVSDRAMYVSRAWKRAHIRSLYFQWLCTRVTRVTRICISLKNAKMAYIWFRDARDARVTNPAISMLLFFRLTVTRDAKNRHFVFYEVPACYNSFGLTVLFSIH